MNDLSHEQNRQIIGAMISNHLKSYPHDTAFFMSAVTHGLNEFAQKQQDDAAKFLWYLTDVLHATKKEHLSYGLYDAGQIMSKVLPCWEGAGIHKDLVAKFGADVEKFKAAQELEEKKKEKIIHYTKENPVADKFGAQKY